MMEDRYSQAKSIYALDNVVEDRRVHAAAEFKRLLQELKEDQLTPHSKST